MATTRPRQNGRANVTQGKAKVFVISPPEVLKRVDEAMHDVGDVAYHGHIRFDLSIHAGRVKQLRVESERIIKPGE